MSAQQHKGVAWLCVCLRILNVRITGWSQGMKGGSAAQRDMSHVAVPLVSCSTRKRGRAACADSRSRKECSVARWSSARRVAVACALNSTMCQHDGRHCSQCLVNCPIGQVVVWCVLFSSTRGGPCVHRVRVVHTKAGSASCVGHHNDGCLFLSVPVISTKG